MYASYLGSIARIMVLTLTPEVTASKSFFNIFTKFQHGIIYRLLVIIHLQTGIHLFEFFPTSSFNVKVLVLRAVYKCCHIYIAFLVCFLSYSLSDMFFLSMTQH
eukprot:NODE_53_length_26956_cov_0.387348.p17 type:complete len:104 gc:universal NODE_53_length_26956_cov_0.387348:9832-10143(+)